MKFGTVSAFILLAIVAVVTVEANDYSYGPKVVEIEEPAKVLETKSVHVVKEDPIVKVVGAYGGYAPVWGGALGGLGAGWGAGWGGAWGAPLAGGWGGPWGGAWGGLGGHGGYGY